MDDRLKPHRDVESERQLKSIIQKIQALMYEPQNSAAIESMLREAAKWIRASDRVLDLAVIEDYESWTDLDGLVGELTMEVPVLEAVSREEFISIIQRIREAVETEQTPDDVPLEYFMNFYREFFEFNFPGMTVDLFDEVLENTPLEELVDMVFS